LDQRRKELQSWRIAVKNSPDSSARNSLVSTVFSRRWTPQPKRRAISAGHAAGVRLWRIGGGGAPWSASAKTLQGEVGGLACAGAGHDDRPDRPVYGRCAQPSAVIKAEDKAVSAATIAWIGSDTPSGMSSWRASGHTLAREGAKILYSDIRAFNTVRDALADDGSTSAPTTSLPIRTVRRRPATPAGMAGWPTTSARSPSQGRPVRDRCSTPASSVSCGQRVRRIVIRDPFTALGGRRPGSLGRIFGRGLGIDPAMNAFGAHRVTAEFSAEMDQREIAVLTTPISGSWTAVPTRRYGSESLANFGRIASGHADRVDTERHRTVDRRPLGRFGTREGTGRTAAHRPLRSTARTLRTRGTAPPGGPGIRTGCPTKTRAGGGGGPVGQGDIRRRLMSPVDHRVPPEEAVTRAEANGHWWRGLSETQQLALVETYPVQIGNSKVFRRWLATRPIH